jgi:hypothetical protein
MIEIMQKFAEVFCYATIGVILKVLPALRVSPNPFPYTEPLEESNSSMQATTVTVSPLSP